MIDHMERRHTVEESTLTYEGFTVSTKVLIADDDRPPMLRVRISPATQLGVVGLWGGRSDEGTTIDIEMRDYPTG